MSLDDQRRLCKTHIVHQGRLCVGLGHSVWSKRFWFDLPAMSDFSSLWFDLPAMSDFSSLWFDLPAMSDFSSLWHMHEGRLCQFGC